MKRIILDTDLGTDVDDALALALALASPEVQLDGITTVHADAPLRARIARRLLEVAGRSDVPVIAGASRPLAPALPATFHWPPRLWGHEGKGLLSSEERRPSSDPEATADAAARFIVERVSAAPGDISLVAIGPLTNIARALHLEPRLADWIRDLTMMGGMVDPTRVPWPPVLETNLNADPQAAAIVFAAGMPLTLVPFEVTTQVFLSPEQRQAMRTWGHPLANALLALMEEMFVAFATFSRALALPGDIFEGQRTYMHDPLALYVSVATDLVTLRDLPIRLVVRDEVVRTIVDGTGRPNVRVCTAVDAPGFVTYWLDRLYAYGKREV